MIGMIIVIVQHFLSAVCTFYAISQPIKICFFCRMALLLNSMLTIGIDHKANLNESIVSESKKSEFCIDGQLSVLALYEGQN